MPAKSVATEGDVTVTLGTTAPTGLTPPTGWAQDGDITYTTYPFFTVGGKAVIHQASCSFKYTGTDSGGTTQTMPSSVTLTANPTVLQKGTTNVLLNGDTASDTPYGNTLTVVTTNPLKSE
jgi:hypothetical protein